jgi:hypothetical protein
VWNGTTGKGLGRNKVFLFSWYSPRFSGWATKEISSFEVPFPFSAIRHEETGKHSEIIFEVKMDTGFVDGKLVFHVAIEKIKNDK